VLIPVLYPCRPGPPALPRSRRLTGPSGRAKSVGVDHRPPQGGVDRGAFALAEARSVSQALRLLLGRRYPFGGPARGLGAVHPGHHRRDAGRQEGNSSASPTAGRDCPLDNGRSVEETGCGKRTSGPRAERLDEIRDKA
jgi:hypothetical protein